MKDFLYLELEKCIECQKLIDQFHKLQSNEICVMSSRVDEDTNKKEIVTLPKITMTSPYFSKVSVPYDSSTSRYNY